MLWGGLGTANLHEAQVHRRIAGDVRETSWASGVAAQIWRQRVQRCGDSAECEGSIEGQSYLKHWLQELHDSAHLSQTFLNPRQFPGIWSGGKSQIISKVARFFPLTFELLAERSELDKNALNHPWPNMEQKSLYQVNIMII